MKKKKNIVLSAVGVTGITFIIKFLGLLKQSVIASCCGATVETDAFFIATGVIVQLCTAVFSAISVSLLSIHTEKLIKEGREASNLLINCVLRLFVPFSVVLSALCMIGAPVLARILAPSYEGNSLLTLTFYIRVMSLSFVLWCYYLIVNVVLETDKRFVPGKCQGLFQNVLLIISALFLFEDFGMKSLVFAFLLSGVLQCVFITFCARNKLRLIFSKSRLNGEVIKLVRLAIPLLIGNAIYEINDIVDKQISSSLGEGYVSVLSYGGTINEIVTGVVVTSISTVVFSHFASWIVEKKYDLLCDLLKQTLELVSIIVLPIMIICLNNGTEIVKLLYGRGQFADREIHLTYQVVIGYALGFVFQAARANIVKVYYAYQDTRTPMINGAIAVGLNIVLSMVLSNRIGISGIAIATSISMLIVTGLLIYGLKKYLPELSLKNTYIEIGKGFLACTLAFVVAYVTKQMLPNYYLVSLIVCSLVTVIIYGLVLYLLKSSSIKRIISFLFEVN